VVVGTPGRIIDLVDRKALNLDKIKLFILDEADRMLDMGFQEDIEKIFNKIYEA
jgi:ATP-dependent RNA helicase DeaD